MAIRTRIEPINRDIELMQSEMLSPAARSAAFAEFAGEQIAEAKQTNRNILGRIPRSTTTVDGVAGAVLTSVKPGGVIITEFEVLTDTLAWIGEQLVTHSPFKSGRYQRAHTLYADGVEVVLGGVIPDAEEYVFINAIEYARKIERGSSSQAPDGVFQAVATLASRKFGNVAKISFAWRGVVSGSMPAARVRTGPQPGREDKKSSANKSDNRFPAIIVRVGKGR